MGLGIGSTPFDSLNEINKRQEVPLILMGRASFGLGLCYRL